MLDEKTKELIAIGASVTANCQSCIEYHTEKARTLGATSAEMLAAIEVGQLVRRGAAAKTDRFAARHVSGENVPEPAASCDCA